MHVRSAGICTIQFFKTLAEMCKVMVYLINSVSTDNLVTK